MRVFKFIFFIFLPLNLVVSQNISGRVTYGVSVNKEYEKHLEDNKTNSIFQDVNAIAENSHFILEFNNNASYFFEEEVLLSDHTSSLSNASRKIIGGGNIYTNLKEESIYIDKSNLYGEKIFIKRSIDSLLWKITNSTKTISGYKCYKAVTIKTVKNPKGNFDFEIEAWFSPVIPVKFGPKHYSNLPGLILELKDSHYTFTTEAIKVLNNKQIKINRPAMKKIINDSIHRMNTSKMINVLKN